MVPEDVSTELAPRDTEWNAPDLEDFTDQPWDELSDGQRSSIAGHFGWRPEGDYTFTDLKLPHHRPEDGAVVWNGVVAAAAALEGARGGVEGLTEDQEDNIRNHLGAHYDQFDEQAPWEEDDKMNLNYTLNGKPKSTKHFGFEIKEMIEDQNTAIIKGYGSTFGNVDLGGDIVEKGAFEKTLQEKNGKVYFLKDHRYDLDNQLGVATLREDQKGLYGEFELNLETEQGRMAYAQAKQANRHGIPLGMSIGYDTVKEEYDSQNDIRRLKELKLYEVSLTMFPMNEEATMTDVKNLQQRFEKAEELLAQAKTIIDSLHKSEPDSHSSDEAELEQELQDFLTEMKSNKNTDNDE